MNRLIAPSHGAVLAAFGLLLPRHTGTFIDVYQGGCSEMEQSCAWNRREANFE